MASNPENEPRKAGGNGFWLAVGGVVVGYFLGQGSGTPASEKAYAGSPPPLVATPDDTFDTTTEGSNNSTELADVTPAVADPATEDETSSDEATTADGYDTAYYPQTAPPTTFDAESSDDTDPTAADAAPAAATAAASSNRPWERYQQASEPQTYGSTTYVPIPSPRTYEPPKCEGLGCYGQISETTGLPRTTYVRGYTRRDGTYVQPHYRSHRGN